jgi:putative restriction endonuclease
MQSVTPFPNTEAGYSLRAYLALIGLARTRSTITYTDLSQLIHRGGAHMMGPALEPLKDWCKARALPPLTVLVVSKETGLPGEGVEVADIPRQTMEVFKHDWLSHMPPTVGELSG